MKKSAKKPTDRVMLTVRIPRSLRDELKVRSLSQQTSLQRLVEESLKAKNPRKKPVDTSWLREMQVTGGSTTGTFRREEIYKEHFEHKFGALGQ